MKTCSMFRCNRKATIGVVSGGYVYPCCSEHEHISKKGKTVTKDFPKLEKVNGCVYPKGYIVESVCPHCKSSNKSESDDDCFELVETCYKCKKVYLLNF